MTSPAGLAFSKIERQIGERLRECRRALGLTQQALAKQINVSYQKLRKCECGENRFSSGGLAHVTDLLGGDLAVRAEPTPPAAAPSIRQRRSRRVRCASMTTCSSASASRCLGQSVSFAFRRPTAAVPHSQDRLREPRRRSNRPATWIRTLPCLITGSRRDLEAAHIRYGDIGDGKREAGMGEKPNDQYVTPLTPSMHRTGPDARHRSGERASWANRGIDPLAVARDFRQHLGDTAVALAQCRRGILA